MRRLHHILFVGVLTIWTMSFSTKTLGQTEENEESYSDWCIYYADALKQVKDINSEDYVLIDLRSRADFDRGHIATVIPIPYNEIEKYIPNIPKTKTVILYCDDEKRAAIAFAKLKELGYEPMFACSTDVDCGPNTSCRSWTCQCDEGYQNCDGDWTNGCECPPGCWCEGDQCLPVELSSFTIIAGDGKVILHWVTESEVRCFGFVILRSEKKEGDYQEISSYHYNENLKSTGNSTTRHEYSYTDRNLNNGVTYYYKLVDVDFNGTRTEHGPIFATPHSSEIISEEPQNLPTEFALYQNYPNPFNPNTTISFDLAQIEGESAEAMHTELRVFDVLGTEVKVIVSENLGAGKYSVQWDGRDKFAEKVSSGVYFYVLKTPSYIETRKMLFVR